MGFGIAVSRASISLRDHFTAAALSKPGQIFIEHAGIAVGIVSIAGDLLMGSAYLPPAIAYFVSDGSWIISNLFKLKAKRLERTGDQDLEKIACLYNQAAMWKKGAGAAGLTAIGLFLTEAKLNHLPGFTLLAFSMIPGVLQTTSIITETNLHNLSEKFSNDGYVKRFGRFLSKYPIFSSTIPDLLGIGGVAVSSLSGPHPLKMLAATFLWGTGDVAVLVQDDNLVKWLKQKKSSAEFSHRL